MGKKYYETKEFKDLQKEYYKKLKKSGFVDVETDSERDQRIVNTQHFKIDPKAIQYMARCKQYLHSGKIAEKLDLFIFEKHCEGLTQSEISDLLDRENLRKIERRAVSDRIRKILEIAGIDHYEIPPRR